MNLGEKRDESRIYEGTNLVYSRTDRMDGTLRLREIVGFWLLAIKKSPTDSGPKRAPCRGHRSGLDSVYMSMIGELLNSRTYPIRLTSERMEWVLCA